MLDGVLAFAAAMGAGTLVEYLGHRVMHARMLLTRRHAEHHQDGHGQGVLGEFVDYSAPALVFLWVGFLHSVAVGLGCLLGALTYAALAAYAHQLQHERPDLVFWLPRPVHHLHHAHHMWQHNFGIVVDVWDRVFGTYRVVDWHRPRPPRAHPWRALVQIRWY
jgi:sterol desaturase/sphingolipid hydroxylase (fatty acid hydroxylase superfamily)